MTKSRTLLTPARSKGKAIELSALRFRKQVLPLSEIRYKGRRLKFDRQYLADLAASFKQGAFDQVPFVLANDLNQHNENPLNFRGEVTGLEMTDDGLDAIFEFPDEASAEVVRKNPKLGVSARIIEGHDRADGRTFKRVIRHVLGTMDPVATGMRPWTEIALSGYNPTGKVLDLTSETYQETKMGKSSKGKGRVDLAVDVEDETDEIVLTDDELEQIVADAIAADLDEDLDDDDLEPEGGEPVQLSRKAQKAIDLANARSENAEQRAFAAQAELAQTRWINERRAYQNDGVPPTMLDLAAPILSSVDAVTIDLANSDEPLDVADTIRGLLDLAKGVVDLSKAVGYSAEPDAERDADDKLMDLWPES